MRYLLAANLPLPARPRVGPAPYEVVWQPARTSAILDMLPSRLRWSLRVWAQAP